MVSLLIFRLKNKFSSMSNLACLGISVVLLAGFFSPDVYSQDRNKRDCNAPWAPTAEDRELEPLRSFHEQFVLDAAIASQFVKSTERSCLISYEESKRINNILYVDVREKEFYGNGYIATAINVPAHLLNSKPFLKKRPIVLVDHGYRHMKLLSLCEELVRQGFLAVYVLSGGMYLHGEAGAQKNVGGAGDVNRFPMISPKEFSFVQEKDKWIIFDFGLVDYQGRNIYSFDLDMTKKELREAMRATLETFIERHGFTPLVLAINEAGDRYDDVKDIFPEGELGYLYFMQGGTRAYNIYMQEQRKMAQQKIVAGQQRSQGCF